MLQQAIEATKSLDDQKLADYIRKSTFNTVLGDVKFGEDGEWAQSRVLQVQFQNIKGNDVNQFKGINTQVVIYPKDYVSGNVIYPYEKANQRFARFATLCAPRHDFARRCLCSS